MAITAVVAHGASVATAAGGVSIAVADAPPTSSDPRTAFYIVESARPGATVDRLLHVRNDDAQPVRTALYVGGATVRGGTLQFDDRSAPAAPIARWSTVTPSAVTLAPGTTSDVRLRIAVPADARSGEQLGVIWAETSATGAGGASVNRVGVRIYFAVGPHPPTSDLELVAVTPVRDPDGTARVEVRVRDSGRREIEPSGELLLTDRPGAATPFAPGVALRPGDEGVLRAAIATPVGPDPMRVELRVRGNGVERTASLGLSFPSRPGTRGDPVPLDRGARGSSRTGPAVLAIVLAAVGALAASRTRRRRSAP